jgi:predicted hotdog family 3-hydroxylacyl-ACP dehydratase
VSRFPPIADLVPHAPPTLALDELIDWTPGTATVRLTVPADGLAGCGPARSQGGDDRIDAVLTLEHMAQAVAACLGHEAFLGGSGIRVGMVVGCRRMAIARPRLVPGEVLTVRVARVRGTDEVSIFDAEVLDHGGCVVSSATMTVWHGAAPPD